MDFNPPDIMQPPDDRRPVIILTGPTASGKSSLGIRWAQRLNGVIINSDSQQVYQELRVLSARPSVEEEALVPHKLYGFRSILDPYSANLWRIDALQEIDKALEQGQVPILVGGTGFYIRALTQGLSPLPSIPADVRQKGVDLYDSLGPQQFHQKLATIDPQMAQKLMPNDRQRCVHAWEVYQVSGKTLTQWQSEPLQGVRDDLFFYIFVLHPERSMLYDKINRRFDQMMEWGAMDEVEHVHDLNPDPLLPGIKACGLPALRAYLDGDMPWHKALNLGKKQTRHYAKRQLTWMRNQLPDGLQRDNMHVRHLTKS